MTLGTPVTDSAATGASEFYQVTTAAGSDLHVALTGPAGNSNELYVAFGVVPSRQAFNARGVQVGSASQVADVANTQAGTYYVLVYGASVPSPSGESFGLTASTPGVSLHERQPGQGEQHRAGDAVDPRRTTRCRLPAATGGRGRRHPPASGGLRHRFGSSRRRSTCRACRSERPTCRWSTAAASPRPCRMPSTSSRSPGQLVTHLIAPVRYCGAALTVTVEYTNTGDTDMPAPTLFLTDTGLSQLSFTPDMSSPTTYLEMVVRGATGPAGILPPGSTNRFTVYASAPATSGNKVSTFWSAI